MDSMLASGSDQRDDDEDAQIMPDMFEIETEEPREENHDSDTLYPNGFEQGEFVPPSITESRPPPERLSSDAFYGRNVDEQRRQPLVTPSAQPHALLTNEHAEKRESKDKKRKRMATAAMESVAVVMPPDICAAAAGAVQRLGTEQGWAQMNGWLRRAVDETSEPKTATREQLDTLAHLLRQLLQANISADLLRVTDTPRMVRRLAKKHHNSAIQRLAGELENAWRAVIEANNEETMPKKAEKRKTTNNGGPPSPDGSGGLDAPPKKAAKFTPPVIHKDHNVDKKPQLPKTTAAKAKIFTQRPRSTGLEEGPESTTTPAASTAIPKRQPLPSTAARIPKKPAPAAGVASSSFMDMLSGASASAAAARRPVTSRRTSTGVAAPTTTTNSVSLMPQVMEGLFADTAAVSIGATAPGASSASPPYLAPGASPRGGQIDEMIERRTAAEKQKQQQQQQQQQRSRKIRFADEIGKELVQTKWFEVQDGERVNVSNLTPEQRRHLDAQNERTALRGRLGHYDDDDAELPNDDDELLLLQEPFQERRQWRLVSVADSAWPRHEIQSEEAELQQKREATVMRAFDDPNRPSELAEDDSTDGYYARKGEALAAARERPPPADIPLESVDDDASIRDEEAYDLERKDEEGKQPEQPKKQDEDWRSLARQIPTEPERNDAAGLTATPRKELPAHLASLISGLKSKGIMGGGGGGVPQPTTPNMMLQQPPPTTVFLPVTQPLQQQHLPPMVAQQLVQQQAQQQLMLLQAQQQAQAQAQLSAALQAAAAAAAAASTRVQQQPAQLIPQQQQIPAPVKEVADKREDEKRSDESADVIEIGRSEEELQQQSNQQQQQQQQQQHQPTITFLTNVDVHAPDGPQQRGGPSTSAQPPQQQQQQQQRSSAGISSRVCNFWLTHRRCRYGATCKFAHSEPTQAVRPFTGRPPAAVGAPSASGPWRSGGGPQNSTQQQPRTRRWDIVSPDKARANARAVASDADIPLPPPAAAATTSPS